MTATRLDAVIDACATSAQREASVIRTSAARDAPVLILHTHRTLIRRLDRVLRPYGLTFARNEVLSCLVFSPGRESTPGTLSEYLQVHPTSISNVVDRLARDGLVERLVDDHDRRVIRIKITGKGRRVHARATPRVNEDVFESLGLDPGQMQTLLAVLQRFRITAGDL